MKRLEMGRALLYLRDSGGKHETTPSQYVRWAQQTSAERCLSFSGTPEKIEAMIRERRPIDGDLFLDYEVPGDVLSREGLNALIRTAAKDSSVSHVLVPRRDRLARPNDPVDAMMIENRLRKNGLALVFMNGQVLGPLGVGHKHDIAELITGIVDYDRAEKAMRDLAAQMISSQISQAHRGHSSGGRAPYGFERWLVNESGAPVRKLADGERVRLAGHHVVWLPTNVDRLEIALRIVRMLHTTSASRIAATLTEEGTPSPDTGRVRRDSGHLHPVSGVWHSTTVTNIGRNKLLRALVCHGRRSMGKKFRLTPNGPRELTAEDYRPDDKVKVVHNHPSDWITAKAHFEPVVDPDEFDELQKILDERGGTQRGKPRSRDPANNPLGSRTFDMTCGWPMYRIPHGESFRYKCGLYQQSHGQYCSHNHVDGRDATRFGLAAVRQKVFAPGRLEKLRNRLLSLAKSDHPSLHVSATEKLRADIERIGKQLKTAGRNMTLAKSDAEYEAMSAVFNQLRDEESRLQRELAESSAAPPLNQSSEEHVQQSLMVVEKLVELLPQAHDLAIAGELFRCLNFNLYLKFEPVHAGKRILNKLRSGVVTFGKSEPPVNLYLGPTAKKDVIKSMGKATNPESVEFSVPGITHSDQEENPLGNRSRGDWI